MQIESLTAIVSGAASGIGRRFTEALLTSGAAHVIGIDRNTDALRELSSTLRDTRLIPLEVDVSQERSITAAMRQLHDSDLVADVLINNAGLLRDGRLATLDESGYARKLPSAQWQSRSTGRFDRQRLLG
jgi:3-oxoacyl-[acyl-carrier protein] reductase